MSKKKIILINGHVVTTWTYGKYEFVEFSLHDLYSGYGEFNDLETIAKLFQEFAGMGFQGDGLSIDYGYYDSIDDLIFRGSRPLNKQNTLTN